MRQAVGLAGKALLTMAAAVAVILGMVLEVVINLAIAVEAYTRVALFGVGGKARTQRVLWVVIVIVCALWVKYPTFSG